MKKSISELLKYQWVKQWAMPWSFLGCCYRADQDQKALKDYVGKGINRSLFVTKSGQTIGYLELEEIENFGKFVVGKITKDSDLIEYFCDELKNRYDRLAEVASELAASHREIEEYPRFLENYYAFPPAVRVVVLMVNQLPEPYLSKNIDNLAKARTYSENGYPIIETFLQKVAQKIGDKSEFRPELILSMTAEEFNSYLKSGQLPEEKELEDRFRESAILADKGGLDIFTGEKALEIENIITHPSLDEDEIKGMSAYPGVMRGKVKIVLNPSKNVDFEEGDVLVAVMTRPDYLPLVHKASAFITDAGGMLSHAAITARELHKPCIVGTKFATQSLKDGDLVEVDADKGIVRIIKKA